MVGSTHEALHRIFQKDPGLLTHALERVLGVPFPETREIAAMNVDLTEIEPVERRVDTLLRAETEEGTYLLVAESQGEVGHRKARETDVEGPDDGDPVLLAAPAGGAGA